MSVDGRRSELVRKGLLQLSWHSRCNVRACIVDWALGLTILCSTKRHHGAAAHCRLAASCHLVLRVSALMYDHSCRTVADHVL